MRQRSFANSLTMFGYACAMAALFLLIRGYSFNTDDQAEHLPQIYQMFDSDLYPNDYFVNDSNAIFTVRHYYELLVLAVARTVGLEWGLFLLTFGCIALMAYSFSKIAELLFNDRWAVLLAPILAMTVFYSFTVGGNHIMYGSFISSTVAKALSAFGLWQFFQRKQLVSGLLLGISTLFQPLVGLQLFMILIGYEVLVRRNWRAVLHLASSYSAVAMFIIVPVLQRQFTSMESYDGQLYYEILYEFRNHLHYLPSMFPISHYIQFGMLITLGSLSHLVLKPNDRFLYPAFVVLALLGAIVYTVGLEILDINAIGKLQWFKVTVWIEALSAIMVAGLMGRFLSGLTTLHVAGKWILPGSIVFAVAILLMITNSKYLPAQYNEKYLIRNRTVSDLEQMHNWIEANTEKDVSVLISPDNNAFPCQAKRSMPIHYQAIIHEPFFMLPWYDDYREIYGVSIENLEGIDARRHAALLYRTRNYRGTRKPIDFRLDNLETCTFSDELGPIIHQQGKWVLTQFESQPAI